MSGPTGTVAVMLDRERRLRYTNPALIRVEDETGKTLVELQDRLRVGSLKALTALVWAGLLHEEPDLTMREAAERIDLTRIEEVGDKVGEAMAVARGVSRNGDGAEDEAEPEDAEGNG